MPRMKIALASAVAVAAVAAAPAALAEDVKLGILMGFTGPLEAMSPPMAEGAEFVATQVNEQGGIQGGSLVTVRGDDTCADATAATAAADRLINTEKVTGIVGAMCSGVTIAVANTNAVPAGVVMISPSATSPAVTSVMDNDLLFRVTPSDSYQGSVLARLLVAKGINDIAITYVNNDYGKGLADSLAAAFPDEGGEVLANVAHEEGKADYRAELGTLAASGSTNLVILAYASGSGNTILRQAVESGNFTTYVGGDGMIGDALFTGIDTAAVEGMIGTKPGTPEIPGAALFADMATEAGLKPAEIYVPQSYDAAFILALAIEKNGNKRDGLSAAVRAVASAPGEVVLPGEWAKAKEILASGGDVNYEGAGGSYEFDGNGDVPGVILEMTATGGSFKEVGRAF